MIGFLTNGFYCALKRRICDLSSGGKRWWIRPANENRWHGTLNQRLQLTDVPHPHWCCQALLEIVYGKIGLVMSVLLKGRILGARIGLETAHLPPTRERSR